jgi:hypothetical protein
MNQTPLDSSTNSECMHTKDALDNQARTTGSWADELVIDSSLGRRHRIACRVCGKLYGYFVRTKHERRAVTVRNSPQDN